ncbi:BSD domain-containing protein [Hirsutella rhossiliensis]|uniref:BSD domain-containing protein n=1 Tax=Hirsutella rhossiliensis TaxID=111463 RepID=A0A9P8MNM9_9HYPO|nr:BSD domain-containing protein [Hirsutella rhossiliensis]KAH0958778.1 BSD domain-containing protein [Hirsutella rhossiliensis]
MDLAYDYMQDDAHPKDQGVAASASHPEQQPSLNDDIQDAYKAISSSAWGIKIGGFLGTVVKQGESVYNQAQKELAEVGEDATKGLTDLRESIMSRTRSLTQNTIQAPDSRDGDDSQSTPTRLQLEAAKRLKDLQRAEDAADEALLRFGGNVRDFLRDAINIAPPEESAPGSGTVLFESKDAQGRRVIHTSRFDAQLHVIHASADRFTEDPSGAEFETWALDFDVEQRTEDISSDLAKHPELRSTMEQLVPDRVPYVDFWKRYYFFRHGIETAESRRRDLLKAASAEDEVGWDDDSDDEAAPKEASKEKAASATSSTTLQPQTQSQSSPTEARKSNDEKSVADSEASYDVVGAASGKTSQAPNSPKEGKRADDSDDDWE